MNKKYIALFVIILVVFVIVIGLLCFLNNQKKLPTDISSIKTYPQSSNFDFQPIHKIKSNKFDSNTFDTEGYVVKIYNCPPCPKEVSCKPCMGNNIVISENNKLLEEYTLADKEMILFTENPKQFELGKKYTFSIKILGHNSTGEPINNAEIIRYNLIETLNGPSIKVLSPNGKEIWKIGSTKEIKWKSSDNLTPNISIKINKRNMPCPSSGSCNMGGSPIIYLVNNNAETKTGVYSWQVGSVKQNEYYDQPIMPTGQYYVSLCVDEIYCDLSDDYITITN